MEGKEKAEAISPSDTEWRKSCDPKEAGWIFTRDLLHKHENSKSLYLTVDIRQDKEEQDRALIAFYQRDNVQWASPLQCRLKGDVAAGTGVDRHMISLVIFKLIRGFHINTGNGPITQVFEGQPDHLVPSVSLKLLEDNMFVTAGRMMGHSFLHSGPSFPGLSPAVVHILFGGSLDTTPVSILDCPDLDVRDAVKMLDGEADLHDLDWAHRLCLLWNLPTPNANNRKWLARKLLLHTVIERTWCQINQLRTGLIESGLWPLLTHRTDVIPILFPREAEAQVTAQMISDCISWPSSVTYLFDVYEDREADTGDDTDVKRICGYLRTFVDTAPPAELKSLVKFWIGWEVPTAEMRVEIVDAALPTALTCFEKLRLPRHYTSYAVFRQDLRACITQGCSWFGCA
ncbi:uncharacterized protein ACB058_018585 isoform 1-T2 [Synchiropus picturatus]